jgi:hypothetical protein
MKIVMTVDQLKALRARWRENETGFIGFANLVWSGYTLASPIGRLLDTTPIRYDRANIRLTDAIYDAGGQDELDDNLLQGYLLKAYQDRPFGPIAATVRDHYREVRDQRGFRSSRVKVPLRPAVLADATAYARERVAILVEVDKALKGRVAKGLRAWCRLLRLLEAERGEIAA